MNTTKERHFYKEEKELERKIDMNENYSKRQKHNEASKIVKMERERKTK